MGLIQDIRGSRVKQVGLMPSELIGPGIARIVTRKETRLLTSTVVINKGWMILDWIYLTSRPPMDGLASQPLCCPAEPGGDTETNRSWPGSSGSEWVLVASKAHWFICSIPYDCSLFSIVHEYIPNNRRNVTSSDWVHLDVCCSTKQEFAV